MIEHGGNREIVSRFVERLSGLSPGDWLRVALAVPIEEYERAAAPAKEAMRSSVQATRDGETIRGFNEAQNAAVAQLAMTFPSLAELRAELAQHRTSSVAPIAEGAYATLRTSIEYKVVPAAAALSVRDMLDRTHVQALYRPFEGGNPPPRVGIAVSGVFREFRYPHSLGGLAWRGPSS